MKSNIKIKPHEHHKIILNVVENKYQNKLSVTHILNFYCKQIDKILLNLWQNNEDIGLYAIGGYGRKELFPAADLDILIISKNNLKPIQESQIKKFLQNLWDYKLKVSQRVLTLKQCHQDAITDQTFYTSLLESRCLIGKRFNLTNIKIRKNWGDQYLQIKIQERNKRLQKKPHPLEPDIKQTKGGLRDCHMMRWLARHFYHGKHTQYLVKKNIITLDEFEQLKYSQKILEKIRLGLHFINPPSDRLLFERQISLSKILINQKYNNNKSPNFAVEELMKEIYQAINNIKWVTQTIITHLSSQYDPSFDNSLYLSIPIIKINNNNLWHFIFNQLEKLCENNNTKQFDIPSIRWIRSVLSDLKDYKSVSNEVRKQFVNLMQHKNCLKAIQAMIHSGLLAKYIPEFAYIKGQMQFDRYHRYPTDKHTLYILEEINLILLDKKYKNISKQINRTDLLYLAGLFHDLGKGRDTDHSLWGKTEIKIFAKTHLYPHEDIKILQFLVKNHLLMSKTAQKNDIYQTQSIIDFANIIGSTRYLNFLYLLTICDIKATNPDLWSNWIKSLLSILYDQTISYINKDKSGYIEDLLIKNKKDKFKSNINKIWDLLPKKLFLHLPYESILWINNNLINNKKINIIAREIPDFPLEGEICIIAPRFKGIFYCITKTLLNLNLQIVNARSYVKNQDILIDYYQVQAKPNTNWYYIEQEIQRELSEFNNNKNNKLPKYSKFITSKNIFNIKTEVFITQLIEINNNNIIPGFLKLEIITFDRPGLLAQIADILMNLSLRIIEAKIITSGARVRDVFVLDNISNIDNQNYKLLLDNINKKISLSF